MSSVHEIWYGDKPGDRTARALLTPASWLYETIMRVRDSRYAKGDAVHPSAVPVLSLGNITVGGTGKTPVAAWAAAKLRELGGHPAIVMRGYGDDEPLVHARLNPDVPVIVDADRVRGAERARAAGADCAILDDGFQHRRIARVADWVLVAAERWRDDLRLLPAGPLREPLSALGRADVIAVTRKSASLADADAIAARLSLQFPRVKVAVCHLALDALVNALTGERRPLSWLADKRIVAAAAVGEPDAFFAQLRASGARVEERPFRDHHAFEGVDARALSEAANGRDGVVCTLKDAVKLAPLWTPAAAPLWYVSQIAVVERGESVLDDGLEAVLAARQAATSTAG
ncbi:MAG: Tetraacyldisaccharide 4-kinase [Gemmatimonadetes bacterium]|nr:Tetraacyldisaccharide 4-kinase [Gemmatimonadota bacterium]